MFTKDLLKILSLVHSADESTLVIFQGPAACGKSFIIQAISLYLGSEKVEEIHYDSPSVYRHRASFSGKIRLRDALPGYLNLSTNDVLVPWIQKIKILQFHRDQIGQFEDPQHLANEMEKAQDSEEYIELLDQELNQETS